VYAGGEVVFSHSSQAKFPISFTKKAHRQLQNATTKRALSRSPERSEEAEVGFAGCSGGAWGSAPLKIERLMGNEF